MKPPLRNENEKYVTDPTVDHVEDPKFWCYIFKDLKEVTRARQPKRLPLFTFECWNDTFQVGVFNEEFLPFGRGKTERIAYLAAAKRLRAMAKEAERKAGKV